MELFDRIFLELRFLYILGNISWGDEPRLLIWRVAKIRGPKKVRESVSLREESVQRQPVAAHSKLIPCCMLRFMHRKSA